jgi:hypothetical protein
MASEEEANSRAVVTRGDPDPSLLTTSALLREISTLKEQLQEALRGEVRIIMTRIEGIEKAIQKASDDYTRVPTLLDREVTNIRALTDEKFATLAIRLDGADERRAEKFRAIEVQFVERDVRTDQATRASQQALDAALAASKETMSEQHRSMLAALSEIKATWAKQTDSQTSLFQTETRALRDIAGTLEQRLTRIEAAALGSQGAKQEQHMGASFVISIIALLLTGIGIALAALLRIAH